MKLILSLFILALSVALFSSNHAETIANDRYEVQQICNQSREVIDGSLERACAGVQDKYNMRFLCTGQIPGSQCWVESK